MSRITNNIPPGGEPGQIIVKASRTDYDIKWADGGASGGVTGEDGVVYKFGHGLKVTGNDVSVNSVNDFSGDNTLPMTAVGVQNTLGNIEALLKTI